MESQTKLGKVVKEFEDRDVRIERVWVLYLIVPSLVDNFHNVYAASITLINCGILSALINIVFISCGVSTASTVWRPKWEHLE